MSDCILAFALLLFLAHPHFAFAAPPRDLYLLGGTPTSNLTYPVPVILYQPTTEHSLKAVRQVCSGMVGLRNDLDGTLYIMSWLNKSVCILDERAPWKEHTVHAPATLREGFSFYVAAWGAAVGPGVGTSLLLPDNPTGSRWSIVRIFGSRPVHMGSGSLDLFRWFRYSGQIGSPYTSPPPGVYISSNRLSMPATTVGPGPTVVETIPASLLPAGAGQATVQIIGSSGPFTRTFRTGILVSDTASVFAFAVSLKANPKPNSLYYQTIYVLDRAHRKWRVLDDKMLHLVPRTFGSWISVIREEIADGRQSPGVANESPGVFDPDTAAPISPPIRGKYPSDTYMPGVIDLFNVVDGRKISIDTGQQDSEVIAIRADGTVLYRVNDAIYSALITGNKLGPATLVVRDQHVPGIHWAFWSSAPPPVPTKSPAPAERRHHRPPTLAPGRPASSP